MSSRSVEVILTEKSQKDILIQVHEISIVPSDAHGTMLAEPASCHDCSRLTFLNSPQYTDRFQLNITMSHVGDAAFVTTYTWKNP